MSIDLDPTVAEALDAVARLDGTDPAALAGLIVADWLTEQHARYAAVADAISALARGNGHQASTPDAEPDRPAPPSRTKPKPAGGPHPCPEDGCDRTFASPQGVGGHRAKAHPRAAKNGNGAPAVTRAIAGTPRPAAAGRCGLCGKATAAAKQVDGLDACHRCWTAAGRL